MTTLAKVAGNFLVGTPVTMADGTPFYAPVVSLVDGAGLAAGGTSTPFAVAGTLGNGVTDTGNPVKVGGYAGSGIPTTVVQGQRVNLWLGLNGQTVMGGVGFVGAAGSSNTLVQVTNTAGGNGHLSIANFSFNGATWDPQRKASVYKRVASSAASGNPDFLKASAGDVMQFWGQNGAIATFLQLYNKTTAPVIGTDTPVLTFPIAAAAFFSQSLPHGGAYFGTGIAFAFTTDAAGTTAAAAAAVTAFAIIGA